MLLLSKLKETGPLGILTLETLEIPRDAVSPDM